MNPRIHPILITSLLLGLCSPLWAQNNRRSVGPGARGNYETVAENKLVLRRFTPKNMSVDDAMRTAQGLFGRRFLVGGNHGLPRNNLLQSAGSLLIHDTTERSERIYVQLRELDAQAPIGESLQTVVVPILHAHVNDVVRALASFQRSVRVRNGSQTSVVPSISAATGARRLILRETTENIQQIKRIISEVDIARPAPANLMIQAMVIRGGSANPGKIEVPAALAQGLTRMVPMKNFSVLGIGIVNCRVESSETARLSVSIGERSTCSLVLEELNMQGDKLSIDEVTCKLILYRPVDPKEPKGPGTVTGQELSTSLSAAIDDYTVLGAMGEDPVFVVLRITRNR